VCVLSGERTRHCMGSPARLPAERLRSALCRTAAAGPPLPWRPPGSKTAHLPALLPSPLVLRSARRRARAHRSAAARAVHAHPRPRPVQLAARAHRDGRGGARPPCTGPSHAALEHARAQPAGAAALMCMRVRCGGPAVGEARGARRRLRLGARAHAHACAGRCRSAAGRGGRPGVARSGRRERAVTSAGGGAAKPVLAGAQAAHARPAGLERDVRVVPGQQVHRRQALWPGGARPRGRRRAPWTSGDAAGRAAAGPAVRTARRLCCADLGSALLWRRCLGRWQQLRGGAASPWGTASVPVPLCSPPAWRRGGGEPVPRRRRARDRAARRSSRA